MVLVRHALFAFLTIFTVLSATAQGDIEFPGTWTYTSSVPGGKGFNVDGSEYIFLNTNNDPATYDTGSKFGSVTDQAGNENLYAPQFFGGQQLAPQLLISNFVGGGKQQLYYDSRRNVWKRVFTGADDTSMITLEKDFDDTCDYAVSCNKPVWVKDAKGNQTDYVYSDTHGGVLKVTSPAVNSIRPQTRYEYQQMEARYRNASGQIVASGEPIWMLVKEEFCMTSNASGNGCVAGASDEVVTEYDYGPTNQANNLWLRGTTVTADGQTLRTCYYYDDFGNRIAETQPNAELSSCY